MVRTMIADLPFVANRLIDLSLYVAASKLDMPARGHGRRRRVQTVAGPDTPLSGRSWRRARASTYKQGRSPREAMRNHMNVIDPLGRHRPPRHPRGASQRPSTVQGSGSDRCRLWLDEFDRLSKTAGVAFPTPARARLVKRSSGLNLCISTLRSRRSGFFKRVLVCSSLRNKRRRSAAPSARVKRRPFVVSDHGSGPSCFAESNATQAPRPRDYQADDGLRRLRRLRQRHVRLDDEVSHSHKTPGARRARRRLARNVPWCPCRLAAIPGNDRAIRQRRCDRTRRRKTSAAACGAPFPPWMICHGPGLGCFHAFRQNATGLPRARVTSSSPRSCDPREAPAWGRRPGGVRGW